MNVKLYLLICYEVHSGGAQWDSIEVLYGVPSSSSETSAFEASPAGASMQTVNESSVRMHGQAARLATGPPRQASAAQVCIPLSEPYQLSCLCLQPETIFVHAAAWGQCIEI